MLIQVNEDYRITSDSLNIIVEGRRVAKEGGKSRAVGDEYWVTEGYFRNIEHAAKWLIDQRVRESSATSLNDVIAKVQKASDEIVTAIQTSYRVFETRQSRT